jgi:alkylation response protein AidB-like acyl-CoA dehydrogenase
MFEMTTTETWVSPPPTFQAAFGLTEEQAGLRRDVRRLLESRLPVSAVRRLMETESGSDPAIWAAFSEMGLQGLVIPERFGGAGFNHVDLAIVLEEMGQALVGEPFLSSQIAANAILLSRDEKACRELLPAIASGQVPATVAITEDGGRLDEAGITLRASRTPDGYGLSGHKNFVLDGAHAGLILAAARTAEGVGLFAVAAGAPGLLRTNLPTLDQTRKQARLEFTDVPARLIGLAGDAGWNLVSKTLDMAAVMLSAESVGVAQRCLDASVEYAKNRIQFGRPIGSFQAIKHMCADMLLKVEFARSAAYYAAWAASEDSDELPVVASLVKANCTEALFDVAGANIQIHGGIGFTWEHDAHLYFKRASGSLQLFGDARFHREQLARRLGL